MRSIGAAWRSFYFVSGPFEIDFSLLSLSAACWQEKGVAIQKLLRTKGTLEITVASAKNNRINLGNKKLI